jgi:hypothetical protein
MNISPPSSPVQLRSAVWTDVTRDTRPSADEVVMAFCTVPPLNTKAEPIPHRTRPVSSCETLVGRYVVLQAATVAQKALQHTGSAHCART